MKRNAQLTFYFVPMMRRDVLSISKYKIDFCLVPCACVGFHFPHSLSLCLSVSITMSVMCACVWYRNLKCRSQQTFYLMKYAHSNQMVYIQHIQIHFIDDDEMNWYASWWFRSFSVRIVVVVNDGQLYVCVAGVRRRQWLLLIFLVHFFFFLFSTTFSGDHLSFSHSVEKSWIHLRIYSWITCIFS